MNYKKGVLLITLGTTAIFFSVYWMLFNTDCTWTDLLNQYAYFTNQVALLTGLYFILIGISYCGARQLQHFLFHPAVKTAAAAYVTIVGLGYYAGVIPFSLFTSEQLYVGDIQSVYLHAVHPLIVLFFYFKTPFLTKNNIGRPLLTLSAISIYPLGYLFYAQIAAALRQFYVYPFLDPAVMGGMDNVLLVSAAVLVVGIGIIAAYCRFERKKGGRARRRVAGL